MENYNLPQEILLYSKASSIMPKWQEIGAALNELSKNKSYKHFGFRCFNDLILDVAKKSNVTIGTLYRYQSAAKHYDSKIYHYISGSVPRINDLDPKIGAMSIEALLKLAKCISKGEFRDVCVKHFSGNMSLHEVIRLWKSVRSPVYGRSKREYTDQNSNLWRAIGDAPKDGTPILVTNAQQKPVVAKWHNSNWMLANIELNGDFDELHLDNPILFMLIPPVKFAS